MQLVQPNGVFPAKRKAESAAKAKESSSIGVASAGAGERDSVLILEVRCPDRHAHQPQPGRRRNQSSITRGGGCQRNMVLIGGSSFARLGRVLRTTKPSSECLHRKSLGRLGVEPRTT
jgi:hypothetical protein